MSGAVSVFIVARRTRADEDTGSIGCSPSVLRADGIPVKHKDGSLSGQPYDYTTGRSQ